MISFCEERLKESICHSLLAAGLREVGDLPPRCSGSQCSVFYSCLVEQCEAVGKLIEIEQHENETLRDDSDNHVSDEH